MQRQTLSDWECVLVDDGSRDDTLAIAEHFARADPRVRVLRVQHGGIVAALQAGPIAHPSLIFEPTTCARLERGIS